MPPLPTDGLRAAQFLLRQLYRPVEIAAGRRYFAVSAAPRAGAGDDWVWVHDNARALEFLSRPELWRQFRQQPIEILRFIEAMCRGSLIFRRLGAPRLERVAGQGSGENFIHSLMHIRSELSRGGVLAGLRCGNGRPAYHLLLAGGAVEFTYRGRRVRLGVTEAVSETAAEQRGHVLILRHSGELRFKRRWAEARLGRITYQYTIDARSMLIGAEAVLEVDPAAAVSDVVLTIGHDYLHHSPDGVPYAVIMACGPGLPEVRATAGEPGSGQLSAAGATYYAIAQNGVAAGGGAIHSRPRDPARFIGLDHLVLDRGSFQRVAAQYRFDGDCRGGRLAVAEDKMLTGAGFYDRTAEYDALMASAVALAPGQPSAIDYSLSSDYGAEINAFAKVFAVCRGEDLGLDLRPCGDHANDLFNTYLQHYEERFVAGHGRETSTIISRQLAFAMLGLVTMIRASGAASYHDKLRTLGDVLLDFEVRFEDLDGSAASAFSHRMETERKAYVDGHSLALLALVQACRHVPDRRYVEAIDRGLASFCIETTGVGSPHPQKADVVSASIVAADLSDPGGAQRHTENSYLNSTVGPALRLFDALRASPVPEVQAIAAKYRDRIALFELLMRRQVERSVTEHDDGVAIRASIHSAETNAATQASVMLGLLGHPYD